MPDGVMLLARPSTQRREPVQEACGCDDMSAYISSRRARQGTVPAPRTSARGVQHPLPFATTSMMPSLFGRILRLTLLLPSIILHVRAQTSNATCFPGYEWMNNAHSQSPCTVAAFLLSPCSSADSPVIIPALAGSRSAYNFAGTSLDSSECVCSTVTFAMLYACATCQGAEVSILPWYIASENCTQKYLESYPEDIPRGTSVPAWAYDELIDISGHLDINRAKETAILAEPDATLSGFYGSLQPSATGFTSDTPDVPDGVFDSSDSTSIGVIIGAAVGGSVGAILLISGIIWFIRRRLRRRGQHCMVVAHDAGGVPSKRGVVEPADKAGGESTVKLYNPDDPTTYPGSVQPASVSAGSTFVPRSSGLQDYSVPPWDGANVGSNHDARFQSGSMSSYAGRPEV
ncbi:hypothetical protein OH77DRAFT_752585 [Trametes cingulata]|nr:hypothetical protein OH77DRAFT_752585 [Trametes cingulata]